MGLLGLCCSNWAVAADIHVIQLCTPTPDFDIPVMHIPNLQLWQPSWAGAVAQHSHKTCKSAHLALGKQDQQLSRGCQQEERAAVAVLSGELRAMVSMVRWL